MFGYRRGSYGRRRVRPLAGCGCGSLGLSVLMSALATLFANLIFRRRY